MALKVGSKVIYVQEPSAMPVVIRVSKVTPSGQVYIAETNHRFKPSRYSDVELFAIGSGVRYHWNAPKLFVFSSSKLTELKKDAIRHEEGKRAALKQREEERDERNKRHAEQLAKTKGIIGDYRKCIRHEEITPEGRRVVWLSIPVRQELQERRGLMQIVMVSLLREQREQWTGSSGKEVIRINHASLADKSSGFGISSFNADDEDDALWAVVDSAYWNW